MTSAGIAELQARVRDLERWIADAKMQGSGGTGSRDILQDTDPGREKTPSPSTDATRESPTIVSDNVKSVGALRSMFGDTVGVTGSAVVNRQRPEIDARRTKGSSASNANRVDPMAGSEIITPATRHAVPPLEVGKEVQDLEERLKTFESILLQNGMQIKGAGFFKAASAVDEYRLSHMLLLSQLIGQARTQARTIEELKLESI